MIDKIMAKARYYCTICGKTITWRQRCKFANWIGLRKPSPCPHCGKSIEWAKWPHRAFYIGYFIVIMYGLSILHPRTPKAIETIVHSPLTILILPIAVLLLLFSFSAKKFEIAKSEKKNES